MQRQKTSHFSLPLVPIQMMLYTHHEICTALYIFKIAPLLKQVKAVTVASFSLLISSLHFKYTDFAEVQGVFLYQVPPLACTQQQRFSTKFQDQLVFFSVERERNLLKLTRSLFKGLLPTETVKYLDFYLSFLRFTGASGKYPEISSASLFKPRF